MHAFFLIVFQVMMETDSISRNVVPDFYWWKCGSYWLKAVISWPFHYIYIHTHTSVSDMKWMSMLHSVCYAVGFSVIEKERDCKRGCVHVVKSNHKSKWKTINVYLDQNTNCLTKSSGWSKIAMMWEYPPMLNKIGYTIWTAKIFLIHICTVVSCFNVWTLNLLYT